MANIRIYIAGKLLSLTLFTKVRHTFGVNVAVGPVLSKLSRTARWPFRSAAISIHWPFAMLLVLLRQEVDALLLVDSLFPGASSDDGATVVPPMVMTATERPASRGARFLPPIVYTEIAVAGPRMMGFLAIT